MGIHININTENGLDDQDVALVVAIAAALSGDAPAPKSTPAAAPAAKTAATPAKKAAAPAAKAETKEDPTEGDSDDSRDADDALKAAGALVSDGKAKFVKETLQSFGAGKVSELKDGQHGPFIDALNA